MKILNHIQHSDTFLLKTINISLKCKCLDIIMPLVTRLASNFSLITFCLFTELNPNYFIHMVGVKCTISLILSTIVSQIFKKSVSRIRPFLIVNNLNIKKIGIDEYSFPSGHTTAAFTICVMISLFCPSIAFLLILLASLVGISRIYLGVHYPSDVFAGAILGTLSSFLVFYLI
ncbi:phosphatase PAP2 family protein [Clostridium drakei]|uniref:Phosphatase PAP2 family protein n=1 Tax=Clostridium drakei TaxID=332101 RepID=A0A2U8DX95_9CLOT|nr:phosphatase PAP2 family protein [Clostridium drakei]AWI07260.1 phosphatase PAP2 family protein [Clostridium drakei]